MRYPKLREIKGALQSLFTKPYTNAFPREAHVPFSSFRGKPYYYEDKCIGCVACVNVCPTGALSFKDVITKSSAKRILKINWDVCIECGQCELNCVSEKGIELSQEFDISTTEKRKDLCQVIEKEMVMCEHCNKPVACKDHLQWTIKKLGPLYTANTTLITFQHEIMHINDDVPRNTPETLRSDRFRILCPGCRREAVFIS
ncbi:MAG: 4Fe-4S dicluster domain-containing protein [Candidatus Omnitrophota bacterium]